MVEHIWRSFDIRGVAHSEIDTDFARQFGLACALYFTKRKLFKIAVGRDCRESGPILSARRFWKLPTFEKLALLVVRV